jgi:hypothetical protein
LSNHNQWRDLRLTALDDCNQWLDARLTGDDLVNIACTEPPVPPPVIPFGAGAGENAIKAKRNERR